MPHLLNIVGCGRVGRTLGRLWHERSDLTIGGILTRSIESANAAQRFIGDGIAVAGAEALPPATLTLIATGDDTIAGVARLLAESSIPKVDHVFFHCSGALTSDMLSPLRDAGAAIASVHPVKSFADPLAAAASFHGTYCGIEGDPLAIETLERAFQSIGARLFPIDPSAKTLYHAGAVLVCSYIVPLIEAGRRCHAAAGVPDDVAPRILESLATETLRNVLDRGAAASLTGPIARGDDAIVRKQLGAVSALDPELGDLYRAIGLAVAEISQQLGEATPEALAAIRSTLETR
jgi:predicted short-subunit dehydrogenase-like oxidoreductase (DUF2520 family)